MAKNKQKVQSIATERTARGLKVTITLESSYRCFLVITFSAWNGSTMVPPLTKNMWGEYPHETSGGTNNMVDHSEDYYAIAESAYEKWLKS